MIEVHAPYPAPLTAEQIAAIKADPTCAVDDPDQWYTRLGWLVCVLDVLAAQTRLADSSK